MLTTVDTVASPDADDITSRSILSLAREWSAMMGKPGATSKADLSILLRVSRARVTQVLSILNAPACVIHALERAEAAGVVITERTWRRIKGMSTKLLLRTIEDLQVQGKERLAKQQSSSLRRALATSY